MDVVIKQTHHNPIPKAEISLEYSEDTEKQVTILVTNSITKEMRALGWLSENGLMLNSQRPEFFTSLGFEISSEGSILIL